MLRFRRPGLRPVRLGGATLPHGGAVACHVNRARAAAIRQHKVQNATSPIAEREEVHQASSAVFARARVDVTVPVGRTGSRVDETTPPAIAIPSSRDGSNIDKAIPSRTVSIYTHGAGSTRGRHEKDEADGRQSKQNQTGSELAQQDSTPVVANSGGTYIDCGQDGSANFANLRRSARHIRGLRPRGQPQPLPGRDWRLRHEPRAPIPAPLRRIGSLHPDIHDGWPSRREEFPRGNSGPRAAPPPTTPVPEGRCRNRLSDAPPKP